MMAHTTVSRSAARAHQAPRQGIAAFDNYARPEGRGGLLSDGRSPVNRVALVGRDLEYVEQVLGRLNYGGAALRGAAAGALVGALIGWVFGIFNWIDPVTTGLVLALYGVVFGAVVGALMGLLV